MLLYMLDAYCLYNNDIIPLVLARTQSYSLNQTLTLSYIKSEISIKIPLFAAKAAPISRNVCQSVINSHINVLCCVVSTPWSTSPDTLQHGSSLCATGHSGLAARWRQPWESESTILSPSELNCCPGTFQQNTFSFYTRQYLQCLHLKSVRVTLEECNTGRE